MSCEEVERGEDISRIIAVGKKQNPEPRTQGEERQDPVLDLILWNYLFQICFKARS